MKTIAVIGWKNSGKTTLVSNLVNHLSEKKFKVGVVKHAHHTFDIDHPNTDSYKIREAGSFKTTIVFRSLWNSIFLTLLKSSNIPWLYKYPSAKYSG